MTVARAAVLASVHGKILPPFGRTEARIGNGHFTPKEPGAVLNEEPCQSTRWAGNNLGRASSGECCWQDGTFVPDHVSQYTFADKGYFELPCLVMESQL